MSSTSHLPFFGPEDFPLLRAFLKRSGYSLDGSAAAGTILEAAKHLSEIFQDGRHNPVQMLDMLLEVRAQRLSLSDQGALESWENEGGSISPGAPEESSILRWPPRKTLRLRLAQG